MVRSRLGTRAVRGHVGNGAGGDLRTAAVVTYWFMKQTGVPSCKESHENQKEGDSMASAAELRPSEPGRHSGYLRGYGALRAVPEDGDVEAGAGRGQAAAPAGARGDAALGGHLPVADRVLWKRMEPARGKVVRARYADHHTAGLIWTRDDREGHPPSSVDDEARNWWSHDKGEWMSWQEVGTYLDNRPETFVVEVLVCRGAVKYTHRGCPPDGACTQEALDEPCN